MYTTDTFVCSEGAIFCKFEVVLDKNNNMYDFRKKKLSQDYMIKLKCILNNITK